MTMTELADGLNKLYPTYYSHNSEKPDVPFICYLDEGSDNLVADNKVVEESTYVNIELYTDKKDLTAERKIKDFLNTNELAYEQSSTIYIKSEGLFLCVFSIKLTN